MKDVTKEINSHYQDACKIINPEKIIYLGLQGSQNYGLDYENSDVDTKAIIAPSLNDLVLNKKPISSTYIREDNSHTDLKDIRLMFNCFRKQNINFMEILFTPYYITNDLYKQEIDLLRKNAETIARYDTYAAVKCMKGMAFEKLHALQHPYPNKIETLEKFGYDPKQLHHILRLYEFLDNYIKGVPYKDCLHPKKDRQYLIDIKQGSLPEEKATILANKICEDITDKADSYCDKITPHNYNKETEKLLNVLQYDLVKKSLIQDINIAK